MARRDKVRLHPVVFVTCPVCGKVWIGCMTEGGAVRWTPADGLWQSTHVSCADSAYRTEQEWLKGVFGNGSD